MSNPVKRGIYGKLAGDTTLNNLLGAPAPMYSKAIYQQAAPPGAVFPFVIMQKQAGTPTQAFGAPSAFETDVWLVKAIDRQLTADPAEVIAARLIALLNDASLSISGATLMYLRRQSDVQYLEVEGGVRYHHAGALFRLQYQ